MIKLIKSVVSGAGRFQRPQTIDWDNRGVVLVAGLEGSGKTTLAEAVCVTLHGKGAPRNGKGAYTDKTINNGLGFHHVLDFEASSKKVRVENAHGHKRLGDQINIWVDGVADQTVGRIPKRNVIRSLIGISREEWLGSCYIPQLSTHALLSGTDAERMDYVVNAFGLAFDQDLLDIAKEERKALSDSAKLLANAGQRLATVQDSLAQVVTILSGLPSLDDATADAAAADTALMSVTTEVGAAQQALDAAQQLVMAQRELAELGDVGEPVEPVLLRRKADTEVMRQAHAAATAAATAHAKADAKVRSIKTSLAAIVIPDTDGPALTLLQEATALFDEISGLPAADPAPFPNWRASLHSIATKKETAKKIKALVEAKCLECPSCTSVLTTDGLQALFDMARKDLGQVRREAVSGCLHEVQSRVGVLTQEEVDALIAAHARAATAIAKQKELTTSLQHAEALLAMSPKPVDLTPQLEELEEEVAALTQQHKKQRKAASLAEKIAALADVSVTTADLPALLRKQADAQVAAQTAHAVRQDVSTNRTRQELLTKQQADCHKEINRMAAEAARVRALDAELIPGLKALLSAKMQTALDAVGETIPAYLDCMAQGLYKGSEVRLRMSEDSKKIEMRLKNGSMGGWQPPLFQSGGQSQRFGLSFIGASIEVSPHRVNCLWLDEPFVSLQPDAKLLVTGSLIPTLRERVPTLTSVFISAHDREVLKGPADSFQDIWIVETDGVQSEVTMGRRISDLDR